jgi:hypothetical protein
MLQQINNLNSIRIMNTITTPPFLRKASTYLIATFLVCFSSMLFTQQANAQQTINRDAQNRVIVNDCSAFLGSASNNNQGVVRQLANATDDFIQTTDIDCNGQTVTGIALFNGDYDGDGYTISNMELAGQGLFTQMTSALFENVGFVNINNDAGENNAGIIAGAATNESIIRNVYLEGSFIRDNNSGINQGGFVGVLAGQVDAEGDPITGGTQSKIENSYGVIRVSGSENVGGLVGQVDNGAITNSYFVGIVQSDGVKGPVVGTVGGNGGVFEHVYYPEDIVGISNPTSYSGITGLSSREMKNRENYYTRDLNNVIISGFDFDDNSYDINSDDGTDDIWTIYENVAFPTLSLFDEPLIAGPNIEHNSDNTGGAQDGANSAWRHFGSVLDLTYADMLSSLFPAFQYTTLVFNQDTNTLDLVREADLNEHFRLWTQGFPGAENPSGTANVQVWDLSGDISDPLVSNFVGINSLTTNINFGEAFSMFVFAEQVDGSDAGTTPGTGEFPKYPLFKGQPFDQSANIVGSAIPTPDGWSFAANSYLVPVNADDIIKSDIEDIVYVWNPSSNTHEQATITGNGTTTGQFTHIAPFQGFLLQTSSVVSGTPSFTLPSTARDPGINNNNQANHRPTGDSIVQSLNLEAAVVDSRLRSHAYVSFAEFDLDEGHKLLPIGGSGFVELALHGNNSQLLQSRHFAGEFSDLIEVPVSLNYFEAGETEWINSDNTVTLSWNNLESFNSDWEITLLDTQTGIVTDLREVSSIEVELQGNSNKKIEGINFENPTDVRVRTADKNFESRFVLQIEPGTLTSTPSNSNLPEQISLNQNYPNPFNPTTNIEYSLNEASDVTLEVYNMTGQRVAILENGSQSAGTHTVSFDASTLSSGVYVYRLQAGSTVLTRKMTLIK